MKMVRIDMNNECVHVCVCVHILYEIMLSNATAHIIGWESGGWGRTKFQIEFI